MTTDFANRLSSTEQTQQPLAGWVWFFIGLIVGVFASFMVYLIQTVPADAEVEKLMDLPTADISPATKVNEDQQEFEWEFHEILPKSFVPIIEEYGPDGQKSRVQAPVSYLLQAGSFRRREDADKLRAKLILMGMDVFTKEIKKDGERWNRVLVGPMKTNIQRDRTRLQLAEANIETIVLRIK